MIKSSSFSFFFFTNFRMSSRNYYTILIRATFHRINRRIVDQSPDLFGLFPDCKFVCDVIERQVKCQQAFKSHFNPTFISLGIWLKYSAREITKSFKERVIQFPMRIEHPLYLTTYVDVTKFSMIPARLLFKLVLFDDKI